MLHKVNFRRPDSSFSLENSVDLLAPLLPEFFFAKIMCLRGARSSSGRPQPATSDISLAVSEAEI